MSPSPLPLALTMGEPSGIGPDVTLDAWIRREADGLPPFFVLGDPELMRRRAALTGRDVPVEAAMPETAAAIFRRALPVVPHGAPVRGEPGAPSTDDAQTVIDIIAEAVALARRGAASAVVTNPIAKHVLYGAGFKFPGHTEFLGALAADIDPALAIPVMMLAGPDLSTVPVTLHIGLADVPKALTQDLIVTTGRIVSRDLTRLFGIARPRIAVAGMNPHAGENGTMGSEDDRVVAPAIRLLQAEGLAITGPHPADTLFHAARRRTYDVVLAMYHDQALIPVKTIAFDETVNVTLGLPFIRTSPDHGTAFDIAGQGIARPDSLIAALKLAGRMAERVAR